MKSPAQAIRGVIDAVDSVDPLRAVVLPVPEGQAIRRRVAKLAHRVPMDGYVAFDIVGKLETAGTVSMKNDH